jgi:hypothetical protein
VPFLPCSFSGCPADFILPGSGTHYAFASHRQRIQPYRCARISLGMLPFFLIRAMPWKSGTELLMLARPQREEI